LCLEAVYQQITGVKSVVSVTPVVRDLIRLMRLSALVYLAMQRVVDIAFDPQVVSLIARNIFL
jgi:hypothetical protein